MKNLRPEDVERSIKHDLSKGEESVMLSAAQAQTLLSRLDGYRKRINKNAAKFHKRMGMIQSELTEKKSLLSWARQRLDPTKKGTMISQIDVAETALLIEEIEKRRGRVAAMRLYYGDPFDDELDAETVGVLKAAIVDARKEEEKWRRYLVAAEEKRKANRGPLLAFTEEVWNKINGT